MKAYICHEYGPPEKISFEDVDPPVPAEDQILVSMQAAALNFPDLLVMSGQYQAKASLPFSPCAEGAGIVAAVGSKVSTFEPGDKVIVSGGLGGTAAEQIVVGQQDAYRLPGSLSFAEGAAVSVTYSTALYALQQRARLQPGETLAVLGAGGGVGLASIAVGKAMGAKVIALASSDEKLNTAKEAGADLLINYNNEPLKEALKAATHGKGADVVLDPVGGDFTDQALRATGWEGRLLIIGFAGGEIPMIKGNLPLLKGCSVVGVDIRQFRIYQPDSFDKNFQQLMDWFESGKLPKPLITTYPWEQFVEACHALGNRSAKGKLVLDISAP